MDTLFSVLWIVLGCLALFITIIGVYCYIDNRRTLANLSKTKCTSCGCEYGEQAVITAKAAYLKFVKEEQATHREIKISFSPIWHIICTDCGATDDYDFQKKVFIKHI